MVVLGTYPYEHTITLEALHRNTGKLYIYYVDNNKIVEPSELPTDGITIDGEYYIAYGEEKGRMIEAYKSQIIAPPQPEGIGRLPPKLQKHVDDISESSLCLIVNGQSSDIMEGIGGTWNNNLGTWIVDAEHLHMIRDARRRKFDGKIHKQAHVDNTFKIWGDLSSHVEKLKAVNAIYNKEDDSWIVKSSVIHNLAHLWAKK
jgi:hypothetical protein